MIKLNLFGVFVFLFRCVSNILKFLLTFELLSFNRSRRLVSVGLKIGRRDDFLRLTLFESVTAVFAFFTLNDVLIRD